MLLEFLMNCILDPFLIYWWGVVRVLENCTSSLGNVKLNGLSSDKHKSSPSSNSFCKENQTLIGNSSNQLKDMRSLCLKIVSYVVNKYEDHEFGSDMWDRFFSSVKPLVDKFKQEAASSEKPSSLLSCFLAMSTPPEDFHFLKAYCLYKQNKLDEALQSLQKHERNDETMLLESRILYRLGKMDACLDIYQKLQKSKIDMLGINSVAALVMAGRSSEVQGWLDSSQVKATSSFELAYNTVCSPIQRNKYTDAELLLLSGRRTGQESLMEDNWPDEDIEIELSPIAVQLGYVQQRLGRKQDAIEAYVDMIKRDMADESSPAKTISICPADNFQCFRLLYNCGYNHHYHSLCQRWLGLCEPYVTEAVPTSEK
ncbi:hypothetical protein KIW84_051523 [Lathyrus oleraceus]|uniref:U3 small nucleolar RNA-associated protein 20 N-terminal domain-containing protein n=3 Tax=Pisum sativum TaxID=3888 RepID=A0A9D5AE04_PEA|nr:hypothetical protein KIW84_051523 [Pisum sativum]